MSRQDPSQAWLVHSSWLISLHENKCVQRAASSPVRPGGSVLRSGRQRMMVTVARTGTCAAQSSWDCSWDLSLQFRGREWQLRSANITGIFFSIRTLLSALDTGLCALLLWTVSLGAFVWHSFVCCSSWMGPIVLTAYPLLGRVATPDWGVPETEGPFWSV